VGTDPGDRLGGGQFCNPYLELCYPVGGIVPLSNGNYLVASPNWNDSRGAVTWANGSMGVRGTVSKANSLVGSNPGAYGEDRVGEGGVTPLSNGNYVVDSPYWSSGGRMPISTGRGAVTWGNG